jgi:hypothetical protein
MLKDATYKQKFSLIQTWIPYLIEIASKDLRNEHLKKDGNFLKKYFSNKPIQKITKEEIIAGYTQALEKEENSEDIAEFISHCWILRNSEIYNHFETELSKRYGDFGSIEEIDAKNSKEIIDAAVKNFGADRTYLFSVINSVVFSKSALEALRTDAEATKRRNDVEEKQNLEKMSIDKVHTHYQQQIARLTDKYEKKLLGHQKKYFQDTESLKKQISSLQRKISGK